jgi:hypothetical protein
VTLGRKSVDRLSRYSPWSAIQRVKHPPLKMKGTKTATGIQSFLCNSSGL